MRNDIQNKQAIQSSSLCWSCGLFEGNNQPTTNTTIVFFCYIYKAATATTTHQRCKLNKKSLNELPLNSLAKAGRISFSNRVSS